MSVPNYPGGRAVVGPNDKIGILGGHFTDTDLDSGGVIDDPSVAALGLNVFTEAIESAVGPNQQIGPSEPSLRLVSDYEISSLTCPNCNILMTPSARDFVCVQCGNSIGCI